MDIVVIVEIEAAGGQKVPEQGLVVFRGRGPEVGMLPVGEIDGLAEGAVQGGLPYGPAVDFQDVS
ncbi:MAG TPA: hypothetical protein VMX75_00475, partial [Spirochaetia bacterium]|nr:hypothetical protein [Spirochaetia bacterium]